MRRIMIIGGSGSGKSTLARRVGDHLNLPVIHMDKLFWEPGWIMADEDVFLARVEHEIAQPAWVMDGNYSRTWPNRIRRADAVIFLDLPGGLRLWRVLSRTVLEYGETRPDLAPDCPERFDFGFIFGWVLRYRRKGRPKALSLMADDGPANGLKRIHLRSRRQVGAFLAALQHLPNRELGRTDTA